MCHGLEVYFWLGISGLRKNGGEKELDRISGELLSRDFGEHDLNFQAGGSLSGARPLLIFQGRRGLWLSL
jgi:hypothetical protein